MTEINDYSKYIYDTFISRIEYEHSLLNSRLSGFFTAQGFLFAAFVVGHDKNSIIWFAKYIVPVLGFLISLLMIFAIYSALSAINFWRHKISIFLKKEDNKVFKENFDLTNHQRIYGFGVAFQYVSPVILVMLWFVVAFKDWFKQILGVICGSPVI